MYIAAQDSSFLSGDFLREQQQALETNQKAEGPTRKDVLVIDQPESPFEPATWLKMFPENLQKKLSKCHGVARSQFNDTTVIDMPGDQEALCFSDKERVAKHVLIFKWHVYRSKVPISA